MIKSKYRLRTKDVRYLTKKRQYYVKWLFWFRWITQYPNRLFNQISCHIWVKLSKNATTRNTIRRRIMNIIRDSNISTKEINRQYLKVFINLNKNTIPEMFKFIESHTKEEVNLYLESEFKSSFNSFQSFIAWKQKNFDKK